ncbi:MAG: transglycosylase SLT domain-containing protein, partial [Bacteriovorax sp.]
LLLSILLAQSCSSLAPAKKENKKIAKKRKGHLPPNFENFDHKPFPNDAFIIANMIAIVKPELDDDERDTIASQMSLAIKKHKVAPQIMVAIIDTESDFKSDKVSSTGDLSLAQINVEVWNKEFTRIKKDPIDKEKIKIDQEYALMKMAEILEILKKRYERRDRKWYARYHSNTRHYKKEYLHKLEIRLKMLAVSKDLNTTVAQTN